MEKEDFERGRLVSGGAFCDGCEDYLEEGEHVFTLLSKEERPQDYFCCRECRPEDCELPASVSGMEAALAVEDLERDEEAADYEVKEGSECLFCGHIFEAGEWLLVGVMEESYDGQVFCGECHAHLLEHL